VVTFQIIDRNVSLSVVNSCRACCVWVSGGGSGSGAVMKVAVAARHGNGER
jgi:hypothetical protein